MDQKAWLWRKKSSEKKILLNGKSDLHSEATVDDEFQSVQSEKEVELEQSVNSLNAKIASLITECNLKEELAASYEKRVQEAIEGKEKAERELQRSKTYLDEALQHKFEVNETNISLNYALKDCMEQLGALKNSSMELEKSRIETGKKCADLMDENDHLTKALMARESLLKDVSIQKAQMEAEFEALISRLDFLEKENGCLRYEIRMLEKDVDIRNEEITFNRHSVDSLQKQQLEKVKKIKKLEAECQRLRVLLHKRIPGPGTLANMWNECELQQGNHQIETRRTSLNPLTRGQVVKGSRTNRDDLDLSSKRITFLVDRLQKVEKENKILRDILSNRDNASCCSNVYDENNTNSSRSWASALVLQSENVKDAAELNNNTPRHSKMGIPDMNLMDDFVEMEKLAIVAVDKPESVNKDSCLNHVDVTGKELVPIGNDHDGVNHEETTIKNVSSTGYCDWLQNVLTAIKEQIQVSEKSADEILEDIKVAVNSLHTASSQLQPVSGYIMWKSPESSPMVNSHHSLNQSISDIIELVKRFGSTNTDNGSAETDMSKRKHEDYTIRVFGWKRSDLDTVLQQFLDTCIRLSDGQVEYEKFSAELLSATKWILRNCITPKHDISGCSTEHESVQNILLETEKDQCALEIENKVLKAELKDFKTLQHESEQSVNSSKELQETNESFKRLQTEMEMLRESKQMIEDQLENQKTMNEDIDTQLNLTKSKLNDISQKFSSLEVELDDKNHCCQELEGMCLDLQLQLQSITSKENMKDNINQEGKLLQTGWEIKAASAKLAECEAAILNLGNQLKTLTPSSNGTPRGGNNVNNAYKKSIKKLDKRISLLDQMLSDEGDNVEESKKSPTKPKEPISQSSGQLESVKEEGCGNNGTLVVVPSKKRRGRFSFLRKLLLTRDQSSRKKNTTTFNFAV